MNTLKLVFAAGNYGNNGHVMDYPATFDDRILTVGAINHYGVRTIYSGYGSKLDVVALGENILSTLPGNYRVIMSLPRPNTDSVLTLSCEIYNGSVHVSTATISLTVRLNFS